MFRDGCDSWVHALLSVVRGHHRLYSEKRQELGVGGVSPTVGTRGTTGTTG